uniref:Uncharacterized protein n=1 Tax=Acrobeloides nanus TaxID=290746 RepID=A0A914DNG7_9BILA
MIRYILPFLCLFCIFLAEEDLKHVKHAVLDKNTKIVFWGTRHGNRNPTQFLKEVIDKKSQTWGFEGDSELTKFGKRQAFGLGAELRKYLSGYLDDNYLAPEAKFFSSSASRCQMTLQLALAGLYPPKTFATWKPNINWTPVPYTIDDPMLRMYAIKCPKSDKVWEPISHDLLPELKEQLTRHKALLDYMHKNTGWNASLANAADLADNLLEIQYYKAAYPEWIKNVRLPGYKNSEELIKAYMSFMESHQIACAVYEPCRRMMSGYWLNTILDVIKNVKSGKKSPKVIGYASHTEITLALMKALFVEKEELTTTAGFVLEVRDKPEWSVRVLNHDPIEFDNHVIYKSKYEPIMARKADNDGWVKYDDFVRFVTPHSIKDWRRECGTTSCEL